MVGHPLTRLRSAYRIRVSGQPLTNAKLSVIALVRRVSLLRIRCTACNGAEGTYIDGHQLCNARTSASSFQIGLSGWVNAVNTSASFFIYVLPRVTGSFISSSPSPLSMSATSSECGAALAWTYGNIGPPDQPIATALPGFEHIGGIDMLDKIALAQASANIRFHADSFDAMDVEEDSEPANMADTSPYVPPGIFENDALPGGPPIFVPEAT